LEGLPNSCQSWLGMTVSGCQSEVPVVDIVFTPVPFVGPGKRKDAGAPQRKRGSNLPIQRAGLRFQAVPATIQTNFCHQQGAIARSVLKTGEISLQPVL